MATEGAYLDSSAIVKLIADEEETAALRAFLDDAGFLATSELALAEVPRAVDRRRVGLNRAEQGGLLDALERTLAALDYVPLDRSLLVAAGELPGAWLRSLDAIHIVSALTLGEGTGAFVSYDERQLEAAEAHELPVVAPGRESD